MGPLQPPTGPLQPPRQGELTLTRKVASESATGGLKDTDGGAHACSRPFKRPRAHCTTNPDENTGNASVATSDDAQPKFPAHGPGFVVGPPPLRACAATSVTPLRLPRGSPSLPGRGVVRSRTLVPRVAVNPPAPLAQGNGNANLRDGSRGGLRLSIVSHRPPQPEVPAPAAGSSRSAADTENLSRVVYAEQPLSRMESSLHSAPNDPSAAIQPF